MSSFYLTEYFNALKWRRSKIMDYEIIYSGPHVVIDGRSIPPQPKMTEREFRAWLAELNKAADEMVKPLREKEKANRAFIAGLVQAARRMDAKSKNQPENPRRDFETFLRSLPTDRERAYWQRRAGPNGIIRADAPPECRTGD